MCRQLSVLLIGLSILMPDVRCLSHSSQHSGNLSNGALNLAGRSASAVTEPGPYSPYTRLVKRAGLFDSHETSAARRRRLNRERLRMQVADTADSSAREQLLEQAASASYTLLHDKSIMSFQHFLELVRSIKNFAPRRPTMTDLVGITEHAAKLAQKAGHQYGGPMGDPAYLAAHAVRQYHMKRFEVEGIDSSTGLPRSASHLHRRHVPSDALQRRAQALDPNAFALPTHVSTPSPSRHGNGYLKAQAPNVQQRAKFRNVVRERPLDDTGSSTERRDHLGVAINAAWTRLGEHSSGMTRQRFARMVRNALTVLLRSPDGLRRQMEIENHRLRAGAEGRKPIPDATDVAFEAAADYLSERRLVEGWDTAKKLAGGSSSAVLQSANGKALSEEVSKDEDVAHPPAKRHRATGQ